MLIAAVIVKFQVANQVQAVVMVQLSNTESIYKFVVAQVLVHTKKCQLQSFIVFVLVTVLQLVIETFEKQGKSIFQADIALISGNTSNCAQFAGEPFQKICHLVVCVVLNQKQTLKSHNVGK